MSMACTDSSEVPFEVQASRCIDWGVLIDAFLVNAAPVGERFVATVYSDRSGVLLDGMTVVTPPLRSVTMNQGFEMLRSVSGADHYVVVTRLSTGLS